MRDTKWGKARADWARLCENVRTDLVLEQLGRSCAQVALATARSKPERIVHGDHDLCCAACAYVASWSLCECALHDRACGAWRPRRALAAVFDT